MARIKIQDCEVVEVNLYKYDIEILIEKFVSNIINKENVNSERNRKGEV